MNTFDGWNDELYHHGVKGQKWGVRNYQNPDGTLTAAGKARYYDSNGMLTKAGVKEFNRQYREQRRLNKQADLNYQRRQASRGLGNMLGGFANVGAAYLGGKAQDRLKNSIGNNITKRAVTDFSGNKKLVRLFGKVGPKVSLKDYGELKNSKLINATGLAIAGMGFAQSLYGSIQFQKANKLTSNSGHNAAVMAAREHVKFMNNAFGNIPLEAVYKRNRS